MKYRLLVFILSVTNLAWGEYPLPLQKALDTMNRADLKDWAYTRTTVSPKVRIVERYDPKKPEAKQWILSSIDNREPTATEQEEYHQKRMKALQRDRETKKDKNDEQAGTMSLDLNSMIKPGSLRMMTEDPTTIVYAFRPQSEKDDDKVMMENLSGLLHINTEKPEGFYIEELTLSSEKPFSPAFSVKVTLFSTRMTFRPIEPNGPFFPAEITTRFQGKAFYFKTIDEQITMVFSDFSFPSTEN